jgi:hypothetical protein
VKNVYDYLIERYGQKDYQPNLYMMLEELQEKVKVLEQKYEGALLDIKRLEEENVETTNCLYHLENSLDARIDILAEYCRISEDV